MKGLFIWNLREKIETWNNRRVWSIDYIRKKTQLI